MERAVPERLAGWEIHGFHTMEDLDVGNMKEEAKARWLRPNEIHAILCNYKYFSVHVKPLNLPKSGTMVLFDRKMLRNFRKDGYNWKKKKDGKTVKEAHEHLKVGNEERIHVYYAHGEDNPTFVRRCYWLLDKTLEHIVFVHYRETQEGSPITPINSSSSSALSDPPASWILSEETDSVAVKAYYNAGVKADLEPGDGTTMQNLEMTLHEINTLEWEELLVTEDLSKLNTFEGGGKTLYCEQQNQFEIHDYGSNGNIPSTNNLPVGKSSFGNLPESVPRSSGDHFNILDNTYSQRMAGQTNSKLQNKNSEFVTVGAGDSLDFSVKDGLQNQDSFGRWMNYIISDSPESVDNSIMESSISTVQKSFMSPVMDHHHSFVSEQIFSITDISPAWAFSNEQTKILVIGYFHEGHPKPSVSNVYCVCGDACVRAEIVQSGVFRCLMSPQTPGLLNFYLSFDGQKPISQVLTFECRSALTHEEIASSEDMSKWEEFQVQMRLAHLLFSKSNSLKIWSTKVSQNSLKQAKMFADRTSHIFHGWARMIKSVKSNEMSFLQAKNSLFELILKNKLQEWLLEKVIGGSKISYHDDQGQGVIHLCAILGYTWAVHLFSRSGLSLDYRDKFGWTALHWAAYYGREEMVGALLSAGAKANLVTDPTSENPGGCTAADLASQRGHEGFAGYLAEKALVQHFKDMTIAGNVSGSLQTSTTDVAVDADLGQEELYLKDTLAAYRTAVDAAARIEAAFREQSFKLRAKVVESSNPEDEARNIVAAMKIQHAFRRYGKRKQMKAAAHIQQTFRTWKIRKNFLNMRRQAIKIQTVFRGYQVRKQYKKIVWSVGVLEKAILRWRLKRKGFRGLQVDTVEVDKDQRQASVAEEDFFRASRKQAEERVERSVVRVQAMFRSKKAQEEYQKLKLAYNQAKLEYEETLDSDSDNNMA